MDCVFCALALLVFLLAAVAVVALFVLSAVTAWPKRRKADLLRTEIVYNPDVNKDEKFHCLLKKINNDARPHTTPATCYLSVIVPAMNETERLPIMLKECLEYLDARQKRDKEFSFEVIVVDDGSSDGTADLAAEWGKKSGGAVKPLKLDANRGKVGVLNAGGKLILFADADGATKFDDFENLEKELIRSSGGEPLDESFPGMAIGSRAHLEEESKATRSFFRTILMIGFHSLVWLFAVRSVRDTQCGFKLFTRAAAAKLFPVLHIERWAFDVELLYLAERWNMAIREVAVSWHEVDGSKITPIWSWLQMGRDLVLLWFRYSIGVWRDQVPDDCYYFPPCDLPVRHILSSVCCL